MEFDKFIQQVLNTVVLTENIDNDEELDSFIEMADASAQYVFSSLWGDWIAANGKGHMLSGKDITEIAPPYGDFLKGREKRQFEDKIYTMLARFEEANGNENIMNLYKRALEIDSQSPENPNPRSTPDQFGWRVLMKMMGHGVAWTDDHADPGFNYPHAELSYLEFPNGFIEKEMVENDDTTVDEDDPDDDSASADWWKS